jgi:hypothetical protein
LASKAHKYQHLYLLKKPILASVTAKFAVTVDFPTPPLPEATPIIFFIPGIAFPLISGLSGTSTLLFIFILASDDTNSKIAFDIVFCAL